jgi:hypothetical protein
MPSNARADFGPSGNQPQYRKPVLYPLKAPGFETWLVRRVARVMVELRGLEP